MDGSQSLSMRMTLEGQLAHYKSLIENQPDPDARALVRDELAAEIADLEAGLAALPTPAPDQDHAAMRQYDLLPGTRFRWVKIAQVFYSTAVVTAVRANAFVEVRLLRRGSGRRYIMWLGAAELVAGFTEQTRRDHINP